MTAALPVKCGGGCCVFVGVAAAFFTGGGFRFDSHGGHGKQHSQCEKEYKNVVSMFHENRSFQNLSAGWLSL